VKTSSLANYSYIVGISKMILVAKENLIVLKYPTTVTKSLKFIGHWHIKYKEKLVKIS
jgi:hypothetical protein